MRTKKITGKVLIQTILNYCIYLLLLLVCIILSLTTTSFLSVTNIINVLLQTSIIAVLSLGITFVLITGNNDLSVGGVMAVAGAAGIGLIKLEGWPWWAGMLVILAVAVAFGAINGMVVAYIKAPAFLTTLATQFIGRGLALVISGGSSWYDLPKPFTFLSSTYVIGIPLMILIILLLYLVFHIRLSKTIFGRRVYAVGSNAESARVSGINVPKTILLAYMQCGLLVGIATILQVARMNSFWAAMGTGIEAQAIAGAIIGGASMAGGVGNLVGTFAGVLLMGVINNALNLYGIDANWQDAARGFVIMLAIIIDAVRNRYNAVE
ncbi:MAG TPA: ABC transporter permease [Candidatus Merdisoma merdipullorum]|nr:ABC transporter permease [Candidatus Merdisoma merdipullorum]